MFVNSPDKLIGQGNQDDMTGNTLELQILYLITVIYESHEVWTEFIGTKYTDYKWW